MQEETFSKQGIFTTTWLPVCSASTTIQQPLNVNLKNHLLDVTNFNKSTKNIDKSTQWGNYLFKINSKNTKPS